MAASFLERAPISLLINFLFSARLSCTLPLSPSSHFLILERTGKRRERWDSFAIKFLARKLFSCKLFLKLWNTISLPDTSRNKDSYCLGNISKTFQQNKANNVHRTIQKKKKKEKKKEKKGKKKEKCISHSYAYPSEKKVNVILFHL